MIVNRKILREKTTLDEQQINTLFTLACKYDTICNYHTKTAIDSRGYIAPAAHFDAKMLFEYFENRTKRQHRLKAMEASREKLRKILEELKNGKKQASR